MDHMRIYIKLITGLVASCLMSTKPPQPGVDWSSPSSSLSSQVVTTVALHFTSCSLFPSPTMIIYKCRFTGDEMCSDAFKPVPVKDEDGSEVPGLFQISSQKVNKVRGRG